MKLLLDTRVVLWWLAGGERLSAAALQAIRSRGNHIQVSVMTLWEIVNLLSLERAIETAGFERLSITTRHLAVLQTLPAHHEDPFDHLIIAQAIAEGATLVSVDRAFRAYPVDLFEAN